MAGVQKGFPPPYNMQTVLPMAQQTPLADGSAPDTTAYMNPSMDQWFQALAQAEGQSPDAQGVTHLTLNGDPRQKNFSSLAALKGLV